MPGSAAGWFIVTDLMTRKDVLEKKPTLARKVAAVLLDMAKKTLARPATLGAQIERMLADLHSEQFMA